jgi:hypothetical protein
LEDYPPHSFLYLAPLYGTLLSRGRLGGEGDAHSVEIKASPQEIQFSLNSEENEEQATFKHGA